MIRYLVPTVGFTLVALASFSVWAFAGKWFSSTGGLYGACAFVFFALGGLSLLPFSGKEGRKPLWGLVWLFPLSFVVYAILWCVFWFAFKSHFGEIIGSAIGIFGMVAVLKSRLRFSGSLIEAAAVVFLFYTVGYYLGEKAYQEIGGLWGKLGWGLGFGLGMGAGLARVIQLPSKSGN